VVEIGVLAVQGSFREHGRVLERVLEDRDRVHEVRTGDEARACDGFVLPGGESTTIEKLLDRHGLREALLERADEGAPVLATCAGAILASSRGDEQVEATDTDLLGLLDARVERNAFGRQRESFEAGVEAPALGEDRFPGVFIRAPAFAQTRGRADPWARLPEGPVVGVEQDRVLGLAFHPELAGDDRVHRYFARRVREDAP
jgi:5'-phosphate synthase pdxT subunit